MWLPTKQTILDLMQMCEQAPESARYFGERFALLLKTQKAESRFPDLLQAVWDYVENVEKQAESHGNYWTCATPLRPLEAQAIIASSPVQTGVPVRPTQVGLIITVNDQSAWERDYRGDPLPEETQKQVDGCIQAWIRSNNMVRMNHIMYEATPQGDPKVDSAGAPVVVPVEELKTRLMDKGTSGLQSYVQQMSGIQLSTLDVHVTATHEAQAAPSGGAAT